MSFLPPNISVKALKGTVRTNPNLWPDLITSAEEGGYVFGAVCLSVCPSDYSQTCERILTKFFWRDRAWLKDQVDQFWWRSGSCFGSGSPKSEIRILRIGGGLWSLSISSSLFIHHWTPHAVTLNLHP